MAEPAEKNGQTSDLVLRKLILSTASEDSQEESLDLASRLRRSTFPPLLAVELLDTPAPTLSPSRRAWAGAQRGGGGAGETLPLEGESSSHISE